MIGEILRKLPDLIQSLVSQSFQKGSVHETPEMAEARNRLVAQLQTILGEISEISEQDGERLSEEQMRRIMQIPRLTPSSMPWMALSKPGGK
jgi:hypothetical protein